MFYELLLLEEAQRVAWPNGVSVQDLMCRFLLCQPLDLQSRACWQTLNCLLSGEKIKILFVFCQATDFRLSIFPSEAGNRHSQVALMRSEGPDAASSGTFRRRESHTHFVTHSIHPSFCCGPLGFHHSRTQVCPSLSKYFRKL